MPVQTWTRLVLPGSGWGFLIGFALPAAAGMVAVYLGVFEWPFIGRDSPPPAQLQWFHGTPDYLLAVIGAWMLLPALPFAGLLENQDDLLLLAPLLWLLVGAACGGVVHLWRTMRPRLDAKRE